tara:strand:+ start:780 stop:1298 length:519 start_codon:yes stop_codon:yes gene_type:complete
MELLLIYSNKCKHSKNIKNYKIFNEIDKLNIDNKNELKQLPKYVKSVPTLIIKKNDKLTILKDKDLLQWLQINSNNQNSVYNNNNNNNTEEKCEVNECNTLVNNNFSSHFSFIDSGSDNLLENFYSSINSNTTINTPNIDNNQNTRQNKSLDNDYERLMKERNNEFKSIERH